MIDYLEKFKVNTQFVISSRPSKWSSGLNENSPFDDNIKYPYNGTIKNIKQNQYHISMDDGIYGWSLTSLIETNKIFTIKELRKEKIKKLNESIL